MSTSSRTSPVRAAATPSWRWRGRCWRSSWCSTNGATCGTPCWAARRSTWARAAALNTSAAEGLENRYVRVTGTPDRESGLEIDTKGSWVFTQLFRVLGTGDHLFLHRPPSPLPAALAESDSFEGRLDPGRRPVVRRGHPQVLRDDRLGDAFLRARRLRRRAFRPRAGWHAGGQRPQRRPRHAGAQQPGGGRHRRARPGSAGAAEGALRDGRRRARGDHLARGRDCHGAGGAQGAGGQQRAGGRPAVVHRRAARALDVRGAVSCGLAPGGAGRAGQPGPRGRDPRRPPVAAAARRGDFTGRRRRPGPAARAGAGARGAGGRPSRPSTPSSRS